MPATPEPLTRPRPGHANLAGGLKFDRHDLRDILERASARETASRTAVGAVCRRLLKELGIDVLAHVISIGDVDATRPDLPFAEMKRRARESDLACLDPEAEARMKEAIHAASHAGDTLGGVFEVIATSSVMPGLGSHTQWDRKLDGRLAQAMCSIQAIKAVEIGDGWQAARSRGSTRSTTPSSTGRTGGSTVPRIAPAGWRGRDRQRRARDRPRRDEADRDAEEGAPERRRRLEGGLRRRPRAERHLRGGGGERRGRGDGRHHALGRDPREVRRRLAPRAPPQRRWLPRAERGVLIVKSVVLSGFMATGKSTVGRLVARELGLPFVDTDDLIAEAAGKPVGEVFAEGEARFRNREVDVILPLLADGVPRVLSFGGGAVTVPRIRHAALEAATVVTLAGDRPRQSRSGP